jgi:hypothetical protein
MEITTYPRRYNRQYQLLKHDSVRCKEKDETIPITGRGGPQGVETSRLPHFLGNQLTDGGKVVSFTHRLAFTPRKIPGTHFC